MKTGDKGRQFLELPFCQVFTRKLELPKALCWERAPFSAEHPGWDALGAQEAGSKMKRVCGDIRVL